MGQEKTKSHGVEGVVYKVVPNHGYGLLWLTIALQVSDTRIVIAVDPPDINGEDPDLPDRSRLVKLANSVTYDRYLMMLYATSNALKKDLLDRMDKALNQLEKIVLSTSDTVSVVFIH